MKKLLCIAFLSVIFFFPVSSHAEESTDTDSVFRVFMDTCAHAGENEAVRASAQQNGLKSASASLVQKMVGDGGEAWLIRTAKGTRIVLGIEKSGKCILYADNTDHGKAVAYMDKLIEGTKTNHPQIKTEKSEKVVGEAGKELQLHVWQVTAEGKENASIFMLYLPLSSQSPNYPFVRFSTAVGRKE